MSIQIDFICHLLLDYCYQKIKVDDSLSRFTCINASTKETSGIVVLLLLHDFIYFPRAWQTPRIFIFSTLFSLTCKETIDTHTHRPRCTHHPMISWHRSNFSFDHRIEHKKKTNERSSTHVNDFNHFYHLCATVIKKTKRSSSINSLSHVNVCLLSFLFCYSHLQFYR